MTSGVRTYDVTRARRFCQNQHSSGLVTWDTEDKYKDIKHIINRDGENKIAYTALYNQNGTLCNQNLNISCNGSMVSKKAASSNLIM